MKRSYPLKKNASELTLKNLEDILPVKVIRDSSFITPGFLSDPQDGMIVFLEDVKYLDNLKNTPGVSCVLTTEELAGRLPQIPGVAICAEPRRSFFDLHNRLALKTDFYWTDFPTEINPSARIHQRACIAEKNVRIGPDTVIGPNVTIEERCLIGSSVTIRAGVVLGSIGFQSSRTAAGMMDMVHAGGIIIRDHVEILSNAVVAVAVFRQFTTVGAGSRIGNTVFISHNVQVGLRCFVGHGSVVNGNVRLGDDVWIGPGAVLVNNITLGDGAQVSLGGTVTTDVHAGERVTGMLAIDHKKMMRHIKSLKQEPS